jgi:hypothetical protein
MIYRQYTHILRLMYGPGHPGVESERPRERATGRFLDSDDDPTLVEITGEETGFDAEMWLSTGGGEPWKGKLPASYRLATKDGVTRVVEGEQQDEPAPEEPPARRRR